MNKDIYSSKQSKSTSRALSKGKQEVSESSNLKSTNLVSYLNKKRETHKSPIHKKTNSKVKESDKWRQSSPGIQNRATTSQQAHKQWKLVEDESRYSKIFSGVDISNVRGKRLNI